jgi:hypothetical protein
MISIQSLECVRIEFLITFRFKHPKPKIKKLKVWIKFDFENNFNKKSIYYNFYISIFNFAYNISYLHQKSTKKIYISKNTLAVLSKDPVATLSPNGLLKAKQ